MDAILLFSLTALWVVVLVDLAMTLRLVRWIAGQNELRLQFMLGGRDPELGQPAPPFRARAMTGRPVTLDDYAGRQVAFVFVSPLCDRCRKEIPGLISLAPRAAANAGTEIIVVSDGEIALTKVWLDAMRDEDGVTVDVPVLVAPGAESATIHQYNPSGTLPSFCLVDAAGRVVARGLLGQDEWRELTRLWEGRAKVPSWSAAGH